MSDLLKGLTSGGWGGFFAWVAPNAIAIALFWIFVYSPMHSHPFDHLLVLSPSELWVALFTIAAVLGVVGSASSTPLYRLLEGYSWPRSLARRRAKAHVSRKAKLEEAMNAAQPGWEQGLYLERIARYPLDDSQIVPTRFGNAIRAFETYGSTRFNLDSGTMWSELVAVVPEALRKDIDQARAIVDFFVSSFFACVGFGVLAIAAAIYDNVFVIPLSFAGSLFLLSWGSYEMAVVSCSYWRATNQALINLGRSALATALGLKLPSTIAEELDMWSNLTAYVYHRSFPSADRLDRYRIDPVSGGKSSSG
jgi:hypothetical protein